MSITSQVCILPLNLAILTCTWVRHLGDGGSNGGDVTVHICVLGCSCMVLLWVVGRPATIHRCTDTSGYFLPRYEYCILNKLSQYLRYIYVCLNKEWKALSSMQGAFSNKLMRKIHAEQCLALYFKMAETTNVCVLPTRLVSCTDFRAHEQDTRRQACFVVM